MSSCYVSIDIETDGDIPGENSMIALGAVAFSNTGIPFGEFYKKLLPLPGSNPSPKTMEWWARPENAAAFEEVMKDREDPESVINNFALWLKGLGSPILLAAPVGYDFTFVRWYLVKFCGPNYIWHNCIDLRTYIMPLTSTYRGDYRAKLADLGVHIIDPHTHVAVDDAREQGLHFFAARSLHIGRELELESSKKKIDEVRKEKGLDALVNLQKLNTEIERLIDLCQAALDSDKESSAKSHTEIGF